MSQDNCGGTANVTLRKSRSFSVSIDGALTIGVEEPIRAQLTARYRQEGTSTQELELVIPPGTRMEFIIDWTERAFLGFVAITGQSDRASYAFSDVVGVSLAGSRDMGCPFSHSQNATLPPRLPAATPYTGNVTSCGPAEMLGPWEPVNGHGRDITFETADGWIHADFWSPTRRLKEGFDAVSVLLPPGTRVTVIDVAGNGWRFESGCTREYIESQIAAHQERRRAQGERITTVALSELQTR